MQKKRALYLRKRHLNNKQKVSASVKKKRLAKTHLLIQKKICQYDNPKTIQESYWNKFNKQRSVYLNLRYCLISLIFWRTLKSCCFHSDLT